MSSDTPSRPVVAVISADSDGSAVRYAAADAVRHGCGLRLVHPFATVDRAASPLVGAEEVQEAVDRARELVGPDLDVTGVLVRGAPVRGALDASADARMVVVEHRDVLRLLQALTLSPASAVEAYARIPVVCLPAGWSPDGAAHQPVTMAVQRPTDCTAALEAALELAGERETYLRVLHAWALPDPVDVVVDRTFGDEWSTRVRGEIEAALDLLYGEEPPVPVEVDVRRRSPAEAVVAATRDSALLVLSRHDLRSTTGRHLGRVARSALYDAVCPVLLLPAPGHEARATGTPVSPRGRTATANAGS